MSLTIHTVGTSTIYREAERAIVALHVASDGENQSEISQNVTKTSNQIQSLLRHISPQTADSDERTTPDAAIAFWSMSSLRTGSYRPWDSARNEHKERVYTAQTDFEIKFRNFDQLNQFATEVASDALVSVESVRWKLTDKARQEVGRECRKQAVGDAMAKAKDYASALDKENVVPVLIDDTESFSSSLYGIQCAPRAAAFGAHSGDDYQALSFVPDKCEVQCSVKMQFRVD
ncbi:hypothetical protein EYZ11_009087 [Aspergillus tanneri]|uniref:DUF541 domain-containing protein n=1 Tax=Aspergillus tanneri TaxID=1220188 RepID=A0A4S3JAY5_9EURO|nr:uncharacterized protein ATNIH1004_009751 [Aspergillus tanneri]KAA8642989.1 hypothetical protein ATNIH1004_009751 [Aspergillus tanneri]THC91457.1 hypothetical protein EYZ11_009087 [Aspergillus tanneri]